MHITGDALQKCRLPRTICAAVTFLRRNAGGAQVVKSTLCCSAKNALAFVEVKQSKTHSMALERIGARQIDRLYNAAMAYLAAKQLPFDTNIRFDVATLDSIGTIEIFENAFA